MAEGLLKSYDSRLEVVSAGTEPSSKVHPKAIQVMNQINMDISNNYPKNVSEFLSDNFAFVITVCGGANESCPVFVGNVKNRLHIGFDDPADATGTDDQITNEFTRVRNEIERDFRVFYTEQIKPIL